MMSMRAAGLRLMAQVRSWLRWATLRVRLETEMDTELAHHLECMTADLVRAGVPQSEAARRARIALGPSLVQKEEMRASLGLRWWDQLGADIRYGWRMLVKSPAFAAIAIGSLALGIGANTVIFTVAQHMLLDRLNVSHPEQLRMFYWSEPKDGVVTNMWGYFDSPSSGGEVSTSFSYPVYEQMRHAAGSQMDVMAFKPYGRMTATIHGESEALDAEMVSGNYYSVLGLRTQLGRGIQDSDDVSTASGAVVTISDRLWTNRFGRSADVIGKMILVNGQPMTIVGVNPREFTGAYSAQGTPDIFLPFSTQPIVDPQNMDPSSPTSLLVNKKLWWVLIMGRIRPGVVPATAEASLDVALNAAVRATMQVDKDNQIPRLQLRDGSRGQNPSLDELEKPVLVLIALAGLVLLLACANLANLLLARAGARQREMGVRLAMGAARGRILRQVMTESMMLALMGGAAGLLLAYAVRDGIPRLLSDAWAPPAFSAQFSWPIFTFAVVVSLATGLIFGVAPAWHSTRVQVSSTLKDSGQAVTHRRRGLGGKVIVVVQVALSMLLLIGAGLFVRTLVQLGRSQLGFTSHNIVLFSVSLPETRYPKAAATPLLRALEERLGAVAGVRGATLTQIPLISGNAMNRTFVPQGQQRKPGPGENPSVLANNVGMQFFQTFGIPVLAGRAFDNRDTVSSRKVAVISEGLARKYFPNVNPVGRTFEAGLNHPETIEIVGVCGDTKYYRVREKVEPTMFTPYWQAGDGIHEATFAVSSSLDTSSLLPSLRDAVRQLDPNLPLLDVRTQDEQIAANVRQARIFASLTSGFGVLAVLLACVGIYGIMAYSVAQRTNEIGIRMALGAHRPLVMRMVLGEAAWMVAAGVGVGLGAALLLTRTVASLLYGLKAWDPSTFVLACALLLMAALGASWMPARRAAGVEPMQALRHE
jgi:predicted permease